MASTSIVFDLIGRDRASADFDRVGNSADKSGGKLAKMGKLGKMAALGLAAGAGAAAVGLFKLAQGAAEDEAGQARLAKAMQNAAGASKAQVAATEDWITAQGKALGVADDQLRPALQKLVGATGDVGKAQRLAALAMDVSAGSGKSLEAVSTALAKGQNGNVAALSRLGISTKKANGETISFAEAQKRLAALHSGQASTAANTTAGKFARLKLMMGEAGETIGAKLLPIGIKLADWFLKKGVPAISAFGNYLGKTLPPIFAKVKAVVSSVMNSLRGDVGGNLNAIKGIFRDAVSIVQSLWNAFGKNIVQYLRAAFTNIKMILSGAFTVIRGIFKTVSALLKGDWKGAWDGIKMILRGSVRMVIGIVRQLWNVIRFAFKNGAVAVKAVFRAMWTGVKALVRSGAAGVVSAVKAIPGNLLALGKLFGNAGKSLIGKFVDGMKGAAGIVSGIAGNVWNAVKGMMNGAIDKINSALEFTIDLPGPKNLHVNIANIPHLAKGGIVNSPTLALIGEAGPEAVVPLSGRNRANLGGGGEETIVVQLMLDGKMLEQSFIKRNRETGRPLQFKTA